MKKALPALCILLCLFFSGCAPDISGASGAGGAVSFTDALGHTVSVDSPQNVAAVMGSFAETWLLAGGALAAYTQDALDERVLDIGDDAVNLGLMKSPSVELIIENGIDFVILSANIAEHCDLYDILSGAGITTAYFSVETFDDYLDMLAICTGITGRGDLYKENGLDVRAQIDAAIARGRDESPPSVLFIRSYSTGAKAKGSDNMTGIMLRDLNCANIADSADSLLEELSMEVIIEADPDFIFVTTMGASDEKALEALKDGIQSNPAWAGLSAVQNGRYHVLPKELFHLKPNNRWGESYTMLADLLYGA
ncbi:MAG: ABC transporter substrate-binding protein [Oscillospiraceae bacterium]|nr:ABC transporter substrate-binding protein [Oscillospiraceae bacterium]